MAAILPTDAPAILKVQIPLIQDFINLIYLRQRYNIIHYLIDPGKPAQNGKTERSHRTDQEMFYERNKFKTLNDLESKIKIWNKEYNDLEHCDSNGKTPNEMLSLA